MIDMTDQELLKIAHDMKQKAYAPYSHYQVGAAILCKDGSVVTGCNVENSSYGGSICAERTAIVKAISEGKQDFVKLAISVSGEELGMPCGICRQFLSEFVQDDFEIICGNHNGAYQKYLFSDLLPHAFSSKNLIDIDNPNTRKERM